MGRFLSMAQQLAAPSVLMEPIPCAPEEYIPRAFEDIVKLGKRLTDLGHENCPIPLPRTSIPLLLVSGALVRTDELKFSAVIVVVWAACLIADNIWFQLGRRYRVKALQSICKMSLDPDSCVRRTENVFVKYGIRTLLVSKFIPGLGVVAPPLAADRAPTSVDSSCSRASVP
jgi:hypothetical protein